MKINDDIVFSWVENRQRVEFRTKGKYFKQYAIELLEDEALDKVSDIYYTKGNVTKRLDYFCEELIC